MLPQFSSVLHHDRKLHSNIDFPCLQKIHHHRLDQSVAKKHQADHCSLFYQDYKLSGQFLYDLLSHWKLLCMKDFLSYHLNNQTQHPVHHPEFQMDAPYTKNIHLPGLQFLHYHHTHSLFLPYFRLLLIYYLQICLRHLKN